MTSVLLPEGELRVARCDMLDKLIAVGDGDAALLYLYILRHGGTDGSAAARALRLSADRYERAAFTLNNLIAPTEKTKAATDKSAEAPRYTGDELRRARLDDQTFSGLCDAAEGITGRALTEGQLRGPHDRSAPRSQSVGRYGHCHRAGGPAVPDTPRG